MNRMTCLACLLLGTCALPAPDDTGPGAQSIAAECDQPTLRMVLSATAGDIPDDLTAGGDTNAGSFLADFSIGCGSNQETEYATSRATATLRAPPGTVIEQWLLNDPRPPHDLNATGCNSKQAYPQCWLFVPHNLSDDGSLEAQLPTLSSGVAKLYDPEGVRPSVDGAVKLSLGDLQTDQVEGHVSVRWTAPRGMGKTRLLLKVVELVLVESGQPVTLAKDFALYRARWVGDGPDVRSPLVEFVTDTESEVALSIDVRALAAFMATADDDDGCVFTSRGLIASGTSLVWTIANHGAATATIDNIQVAWPASQGALTGVRVEGVPLWSGTREPPAATFNFDWHLVEDERTVESGEDVTLRLDFETVPENGWDPTKLHINLGFAEGCATKYVATPSVPGSFSVL
ncbi:MAG: hypothetical protein AMXMBFR64_54100 [Myxococcales bacterium]